jgi:hypothetical protein
MNDNERAPKPVRRWPIVLFVLLCLGIILYALYLYWSLNRPLAESLALPPHPDIAQATTPEYTPTTEFTASPTASPEPTASPTGEQTTVPIGLVPGTSRGDLHMHTLCSDGQNTYEEMVQGALAQGFTFMAVTDHTWCPDVQESCRNETRLLCIPGVEVTGNSHIVALDLQSDIERLLPVAEQVRQIHDQGGLAIAAHPFVSGYEFSPSDLLDSGFDAIECDVPGSVAPTFDASSLRCVWDSDAHNVSKLGTPNAYMVCDVLIRSFDELKAAILGGHCQPGE